MKPSFRSTYVKSPENINGHDPTNRNMKGKGVGEGKEEEKTAVDCLEEIKEVEQKGNKFVQRIK